MFRFWRRGDIDQIARNEEDGKTALMGKTTLLSKSSLLCLAILHSIVLDRMLLD